MIIRRATGTTRSKGAAATDGGATVPQRISSVNELTALCSAAHFGHGDKLCMDPMVRSFVRVGPDKVVVTWKGLEGALREAHRVLRPGVASTFRAHLHEVIVYEPGDHFAAHLDTMKSPRHVVTLSVCANLDDVPRQPVASTLLRFDGRRHVLFGAGLSIELKCVFIDPEVPSQNAAFTEAWDSRAGGVLSFNLLTSRKQRALNCTQLLSRVGNANREFQNGKKCDERFIVSDDEANKRKRK